MHPYPEKNTIKAIGLMSGGLDSIVAAKVVHDLGVDVTMVHFILPWKIGVMEKIVNWARTIDVKLVTLELDDTFLDMVRDPEHGYGTAMNPCIDCKIHMLKRAGQLMRETGAAFVFTGEVLGQRPMSQNKNALQTIEKASGLSGYLLRPLSAKLMAPTIPEEQGLIDREKLLAINGRSRQMQIELAQKFEINDFTQPGGGCLLTEQSFCSRLQDMFGHGYHDYHDTKILATGRHFRLNENCKVIVGRDEGENDLLMTVAKSNDILLRYNHTNGPLVVLQTNSPDPELLSAAAGILQRFSKFRNDPPQEVFYWKKEEGDAAGRTITAQKIQSKTLETWKI